MPQNNETKFAIGDEVWIAHFGSEERWLECPDCGGTLAIHVTLFDGTEYDIECETCRRGYEDPC